MNTLRKEVDDLYDLKQKIESESFQTYIMKPLYEELDKIKAENPFIQVISSSTESVQVSA